MVSSFAYCYLLFLPVLTDCMIARLIGNLKDDKAAVRIDAAKSLSKLGNSARVAIPNLLKGLQDKEKGNSSAACSNFIGQRRHLAG
jgi:HEAT repeat protein